MQFNTYGAYDYIASFFTTTFQTLDSGQEEKIFTPLYTDIKVKLRNAKKRVSKQGADEVFIESYKVVTPPEYNGANRGDKVGISGDEYVIVKKWEKRVKNQVITINYFCEIL